MGSSPLLDGLIKVLSEHDGDVDEQARNALLYLAFVLDNASRDPKQTASVPTAFLEAQRIIADFLFKSSLVAPR
jgi:hypothetical protein